MTKPKKSTTISAPVARMAGNKQKKNVNAKELQKLIVMKVPKKQ